MPLSQDELLSVAGRLAAEAGCAAPVELTQLAGGKNNRVYRASIADGSALVLKSYFFDERDTRDRLTAEWTFLDYAWQRGVRNIPQPLARDGVTRTGLYSFVSGDKLKAGAVARQHVDAALDFVRDVNGAPRAAKTLPASSEACFTLDQHLQLVERRTARLTMLDADVPLRDKAAAFIGERLLPGWQALKQKIAKQAEQAGIHSDVAIADAELVASPSDFGFHNALVNDQGHITFIDFEYAGHDDPAKLACDFFCQPEIPVPAVHFDHFVDRMASDLGLGADFRERCRLLIDAYHVKWTCIILNDFLPVGAARRAFAVHSDWEERCAQQLNKAEQQLGQIAL